MSQQPLAAKRDGFTSSFGVLAATLGSAVGLGNIWKFPYMTGENGGAGFVLVYLLCLLLMATPIMMTEIMLGKPPELVVNSYFAARRFVVDEMLRYEHCYPSVLGLVLRSTKRPARS